MLLLFVSVNFIGIKVLRVGVRLIMLHEGMHTLIHGLKYGTGVVQKQRSIGMATEHSPVQKSETV